MVPTASRPYRRRSHSRSSDGEDLPKIRDELRQEIAEATTDLKPKKLGKRLKVIESFMESGNRPEWMIMTVVPVIPPELRPLVPLDGRPFRDFGLERSLSPRHQFVTTV